MTKPILSIGLPVYNGERYLSLAMESILSQSFSDFELILSDNASTDSTADIIKHYKNTDSRVKYFRNSQNIGASRNFNQTVELASGDFFKWASYDDLLSPTYLEECILLLQDNPNLVLSHAKSQEINENGEFIATYDQYDRMRLRSPKPHQRFYDLISIRHSCDLVFGIMPTALLKKTILIGSYPASDRVLLAELALRGEIGLIPKYLFLHRDHAMNTWNRWKKDPSRVYWYDTQIKATNPFQHWKLFKEFTNLIYRVDLPIKDKMLCAFQLVRWPRAYWSGVRVWRLLLEDIQYAVKH